MQPSWCPVKASALGHGTAGVAFGFSELKSRLMLGKRLCFQIGEKANFGRGMAVRNVKLLVKGGDTPWRKRR